jgi:para-nitrobenzyl esterase
MVYTDVVTEDGILRGKTLPETGVRRFLGVPYGQSTAGPHRWRPPRPAASWTGVRDATAFGPASWQTPQPPTSLYYGGERDFSEDCLNLNIWTGPDGDTDRPVMVWLHLGAFQFGSAAHPMYDGEQLAARGVTLVSVTYRLGRLGFLAHAELSAESGYSGSGNYGLMDQIEALRYIQRNIAAFGGDPGNVTVFGVSAGGDSVHKLRCSPLATGLFQPIVNTIVLTNRSTPPDSIIEVVEERTGGEPFESLDEVITLAEIQEISHGYQRVAGYDRETVAGK